MKINNNSRRYVFSLRTYTTLKNKHMKKFETEILYCITCQTKILIGQEIITHHASSGYGYIKIYHVKCPIGRIGLRRYK